MKLYPRHARDQAHERAAQVTFEAFLWLLNANVLQVGCWLMEQLLRAIAMTHGPAAGRRRG